MRRVEVFVCVTLLLASATACDQPVFLHALQSWEADSYRLVLVHREKLTAVQQELLQKLQDIERSVNANLIIDVIDLGKPLGAADQELAAKASSRLPSLLLLKDGGQVAEVPFEPASVERVLSSPVRAKAYNELRRGEIIPWIVLESGDKEKDAAAVKLLQNGLSKAQKGLSEDTKVSFSVHNISRNDAAEALTAKMLLVASPEPEPKDVLAFPIAGRGVIFFPLRGSELNDETIETVVTFLTGPCSCEIKGTRTKSELLITGDWSADDPQPAEPIKLKLAAAEPNTEAPNAPTEKTAIVSAEKAAPTPPATAAAAPEPKPSNGSIYSMLLFALLAGGGMLALFRYGLFGSRASAGRSMMKVMGGSALFVAVLAIALAHESSTGSRNGAGANAAEEPLMIYCAAALKTPMEEIAAAYEREYGRKVVMQFGSSESQLTALKLSHRGDLFLPADSSYIDAAAKDGLTAEVLPIGDMRVTIAVKKGNPKQIRGIDDLLRGNVRVLLANSSAAIGKLTQAELRAIGKWDSFSDSMRSGEGKVAEGGTVTEVTNAVKIGSADASFSWDSLEKQYPELEFIRTPELEKIRAAIEMTVLQFSTNPQRALHFARYVAARDRGLATFHGKGYNVVEGDTWQDVPRLKLFCGSMLRPALQETLKKFEEREGVKLDYDYQGCGILVGKMKVDDKPDMYFACDTSFMKQVENLFESPVVVSKNDIVIVVKKGNPQNIKTLKDLADKPIRLGVGHERQCALGVLTQRSLEHAGLCDAIMRHVTVQSPTGDYLINQLRTGSLDVVIAYYSNTVGFDDIESLKFDAEVVDAEQPLAVLKTSRSKYTVARLRNAILSAESRERFRAAGFHWKGGR